MGNANSFYLDFAIFVSLITSTKDHILIHKGLGGIKDRVKGCPLWALGIV